MHAQLHDTFNQDWRTDQYHLDAYTRFITKGIANMKSQSKIGHKSVAFDTYQTVFGIEKVRLKTMRYAMASFISASLYGGAHLYLKDFKKNWKYPIQNLKGIFFIFDILKYAAPELKDYFRADFHPD